MNSSNMASENILKSIRIRNYRVFKDLEVTGLSRINLIMGHNNSGKTSLLEALFLLSGAGSPALVLNPYVVRGGVVSPAAGAVPPPANMIQEILWKPMFRNLDTKRKIEIEAPQSIHGPLSLRLSLRRPSMIEQPFSESHKISAENSAADSECVLSFKCGEEAEVEGKILAGNTKYKNPDILPPFPATIMNTIITIPQDEASRLLGHLRKQKQGHFLLDALRIVEPRLESIEDNSSSGTPMIWGDIGLPELVPLAMMGEGMMRVARLILAISAAPNGVVLIDEIETGLHHSVLTDVWKAIDATARRFGTQVIATTHSFECIEAAGEALIGTGGLALHRLEVTDSGNRCITYGKKNIAFAIRHNFEVR